MSEVNIDQQNHNSSTQSKQSSAFFSLKKANSSSTAPFILVDFSVPHPFKEDPSPTMTLVPTFNNDKKFYTPSFVLSSQLNKYVSNDEGYKMIHEKKMKEIEEEKSDIFVPKPSKANSYCCICREPFDDYLSHINFPKHKELMKKSPYYTMIQDLSASFSLGRQANAPQIEENQKTVNQLVAKKKKIIKITSSSQPKRGRGRPRKVVHAKMQMLASIPTSVSISV